MSLVTLLVILIIVGLLIYAAKFLPIDPPIRNLVVVLIIVTAVIWIARYAGIAAV